MWKRLHNFLISLNKWRGVSERNAHNVDGNCENTEYSRVSVRGGRPAQGIFSSPQKCFCVTAYEGQRSKFDVL